MTRYKSVIALLRQFVGFTRIGVELIEAHFLLSRIVTTGLVLIWSFAGNRFWTVQTADRAG